MYPTLELLEIQKRGDKNVFVAKSHRQRSININLLSYDEQKEFFRLEDRFRQTFVDQHEHKLCQKQRDQFKRGLQATYEKQTRSLRIKQRLATTARDVDFQKMYVRSTVVQDEVAKFDEQKMTDLVYNVTPSLRSLSRQHYHAKTHNASPLVTLD